MSHDHSTSSAGSGGAVFVKLLPLVLSIALAYCAWTFLGSNERHDNADQSETPGLVIEGNVGVGSHGVEDGMLLEPSEDR